MVRDKRRTQIEGGPTATTVISEPARTNGPGQRVYTVAGDAQPELERADTRAYNDNVQTCYIQFGEKCVRM